MCDFFDWDRRDPERAEAHDGFKTALVQQFNSLYGTEVDDMESWRGLSLALDISPLPENLKGMDKEAEACGAERVEICSTCQQCLMFSVLDRVFCLGLSER